jgi:hypothetical protein
VLDGYFHRYWVNGYSFGSVDCIVLGLQKSSIF